MTPLDPRGTPDLSAIGAARKAAMLDHLQRRMAARARLRRRLRVACGVLPVLALFGVLLALRAGAGPAPTDPASPHPFPVAQDPAPALVPPGVDYRRPMIVQVATRSGLADALAVRPGPTRVRVVSDDELIALAAAEGRPLGIIRARGTVTLVAHQTPDDAAPPTDPPGAAPSTGVLFN